MEGKYQKVDKDCECEKAGIPSIKGYYASGTFGSCNMRGHRNTLRNVGGIHGGQRNKEVHKTVQLGQAIPRCNRSKDAMDIRCIPQLQRIKRMVHSKI